ncbi:hypothetical protein [Haloarcula sp. 1CSR25-25]|uniref:hypothetical protein n=1 Tax=Haloarcula sp. 1CSR25-25 TaxID=2862545 RepID=UPI0028951C2C|nr:hypothetical protein [Haloarcula sp. 1CSR25-25]MDT3433261.1 hypothetical protein [Haloarcula sp. 1CSR25-25]
MTAENYRYADGKPEATLVNYTTVRPPELKLLYQALDTPSGTVNLSSFRTQFTIGDDDHLNQCLNFMHALDFIERPEDRVIEPINRDVFPNLSFEAKLLHHLHQQERPQDHLAAIQGVAFDEAPKTLERDLLVTYLNRELDYINWNKTKVNMWYRLYEGIGAIDYIDSRELVLSPVQALLYELLETFEETENSNDFGEAVTWIEQYFMTVLSARPGTAQLHRGVTDTLQNLIDDGIVEVRGMADAKNEVQLPETHSRTEKPAIKEFSLNELPKAESAKYRYPLERFVEVAQ